MKKFRQNYLVIIIGCLGLIFLSKTPQAQIIYQDDFEGGGNITWVPLFYSNINQEWEENLEVVANPFGSGNVGKVEDTDASNTGAALAGGNVFNFQNLAIEADVYCYFDTTTSFSRYTGVALMADTTFVPPDTIRTRYVKLVADFDDNVSAGPRLRLYNSELDYINFTYSFDVKFYENQVPGGFPDTSGWHRLRLEARTINSDSVAYWAYFDSNLVGGGPVYDYTYDTGSFIHHPFTPGTFGLFAFEQVVGPPALSGYFDNVVVEQIVTGINDNQAAIEGFQLHQNYPNPFNPNTTITFYLPSSEVVNLAIYNTLGQKIRNLVSERVSAGEHTINWDAKDEQGKEVPGGVYFYKISAGEFRSAKKMVLLR